MAEQKTGVWIEWCGGECPAPNGSDVLVRFRGGSTSRVTDPERLTWRNHNHSSDIVAYMIVPTYVPKPKPERWTIVKRTQPVGYGCTFEYLTHYAINDRTSMKLGNLVATTDGEYALLQRFVKLLNEVAP